MYTCRRKRYNNCTEKGGRGVRINVHGSKRYNNCTGEGVDRIRRATLRVGGGGTCISDSIFGGRGHFSY